MNFKYTFNKRILSEPSLSIPPEKPDLMAELLYKGNPTWELTDRANTIENVVEASHFISLPVIAFLGTFASGKTFLLDYLLGNTRFVSGIGTTSSVITVITVIRHIDSKPADWNQGKNVFSLKKGSPLNTNEIIDVSASYYSDEIATLSTYDYKIDHDVLVVFMDRPILNKMTLVDCPGTGTASEAVKKAEVAGMAAESAAATRAAETREQELQKLAVECSDGLILLSAVGGSGDLFSDAGFKNILSMAAKTLKIRKKQHTAPLLYIGSLADPQQDGSHDYKALVRKAKESIRNRINELTGVADDVIEKISLADKLVFFYLLSDEKIEDMINMYERTLSKSPEAGTNDSIRESALSMFNENRGDYERKDDVLLEILRLCDDLQIHTYSRGKKYCSNKLQHSVKHYKSRTKQFRNHTIGIPNKNELMEFIEINEPVFIKSLSQYTSRANSHINAISEHINICVYDHLDMFTRSENFIIYSKSHRRTSSEEKLNDIRSIVCKDVLNRIYDENKVLNPIAIGTDIQSITMLSWGNIKPEYNGDCCIDKYTACLDGISPLKYEKTSNNINIEKRLELLFDDYFDIDVFEKTKAYGWEHTVPLLLGICILLGVLWVTNTLYLFFVIPSLVLYWLYGVDVSSHAHTEETSEKRKVKKILPNSRKFRESIIRLISDYSFKRRLNRLLGFQSDHIGLHANYLKEDMQKKYKSLVADIQNEIIEKKDNVTVAIAKYEAAEKELEIYYESMKVRAKNTLSIQD